MSDSIRIVISSFILNSPFYLLCCIPFLPKLRIKRKSLYTVIVLNVLGISAYYMVREYLFPQYRAMDTIVILFFYAFYMYEYKKCFDTDISKLAYVFLIVQAYSNIINIASKYLSAHFFPEEATIYAAPSYTLFLFAFTLLSYPFVYYLLKNKLQNALDELPSRSFWQLCITPILFFVINMIYVNIFARSNFQDGEMFVIYILILFAGSIIYIVSLNTALDAAEAAKLQSDMEFLQRQMALQAENYTHLIESIETTKKAQHDLRHHMAVIGAYVEQDDKAQLEKYLEQYARQLPKENDIPICSNYAVDAVVRHHLSALKNIDVKLDIKLRFTDVHGISDADLCILFGNLIENSVNSIVKQQAGKKFIHAECSVMADKFMIVVDNSCDQHHMQKHGIGQHSIMAVAKAYQGSARFELKDNVYRNSVILKLK